MIDIISCNYNQEPEVIKNKYLEDSSIFCSGLTDSGRRELVLWKISKSLNEGTIIYIDRDKDLLSYIHKVKPEGQKCSASFLRHRSHTPN